MDLCFIEAVNAVWTSLGIYVAAGISLAWVQRRHNPNKGQYTDGRRGGVIDDTGFGPEPVAWTWAAFVLMTMLGTYYGQQAVRYGVASAGGGSVCVYERGSVRVIPKSELQ